MGMTSYLGIIELAKQLNVPYYRIRYAHNMGYVPEPTIVARTRVYGPDDVERVREYFKVTNTEVRGQ